MAMTDEELLLQMNILATRTDTNENMPYKTNAILNKGLNPEFFSGQQTKIVNAINTLAANSQIATNAANSVTEKINTMILDESIYGNDVKWDNLKTLMDQPTIVEGLIDLYSGNKAAQILGVTENDVNKVLSVDTDENGNVIIKAIDKILNQTEVNVENIAYTNINNSSITNVKQALDYVINAVENGDDFEGGLGGGTIIGDISWDMIDDRPMIIADDMELTNEELQLKDGDSIISSVPIANNDDINDIMNNLD